MIDLRLFTSADEEVPVTLPCGIEVVLRPLSPVEREAANRRAGPAPMYGQRVEQLIADRCEADGVDRMRVFDDMERDDPQAAAAYRRLVDWRQDVVIHFGASGLVDCAALNGGEPWRPTPAEAFNRIRLIQDDASRWTFIGELFAEVSRISRLGDEGKAQSEPPCGSDTD